MSHESDHLVVTPGEHYKDPYSARIQQALYQNPVFPILYNEVSGLNPDFSRALQNVNSVTEENGICDHGWDHISQVARNAMMLTDIARVSSPRSGTMIDISDSELLTDGMILFAAMHSDLAYGDRTALVEGRSVFDHGERSTALIDGYNGLTGSTALDDSVRLIERNSPALKASLSIDMDEATTYAAHMYIQPEAISPQQIFVVILKLADIFDYYRASRVAKISETGQQDNPYYHLAKKVSEYELVYDGSLIYRARMDPQHIGISQSGSAIYNFSDWYAASRITVDADRKNYDQVWQLADLYSSILGINFKVEELV